MTVPDRGLDALFRRWARSTAQGFALLTVGIVGVYYLLGSDHGDAVSAKPAVPAYVLLSAIYAIFVGYSFFNWRAVRAAFLSGESADKALRKRL
jgi:hypothetical protein